MKVVIRVNGRPAEPESRADVVEVEPGIYSLILDGCSYEAAVTGSEIVIDGSQVLQIEVEDPRKWNPAGASRNVGGREAIKAPMPGKVVRVLVAAGDEVAAGHGLVVLEAMKMQNEMKAPRAGRVMSVAVKEHEAVNAGSVLLTIE
jgi:biotin carboxyl carrier protein